MAVQLLHTKCHLPPTRPNSVPRARLGETLQGGLLAGRKLTLISAPAGYGKTTLAAGWARQSDLPIAWLSLDEQDDEFGRFLAYLLLSLQQAASGAGAQIRLILDAPQLPPVETIAVGLSEELARLGESNGRFLLALDDYHKIRQPLIHDLLNRLLEHLPPACHLLLISREDPPLPLPRLRARGEMTEIRAQDLRFTVAEAEQFFNQTMQLGLSPDWVAALETRTEGWIASLQLAALSLHGRDAAQTEAFIRAFGGSHRYVFDYLAEEVLGQQPEEIRAFLRATAVLNSFNAPLCHALTGRADSQAILHQLEQANLFLIPLDDERDWFRYHHLFAEYLRAGLDQAERTALYQQAACWCEANALLFEAVRYALKSDDPDFATALIERALLSDQTWSGGHIALLSSWLDALPPQIWQSRPKLSLQAARVLDLAKRYDLAERYIDQTEQSVKAMPETAETGQLLALAALYRGSIAAIRGDVAQAVEQTTFAQARLAPDNRLAHARAAYSLGLVHELSGDAGEAVRRYLQSGDEARAAGVFFLEVHARCAAAQMRISQGRLHLAEQTCRQAEQVAEREGLALLGLPRVILGEIALERNELAAAAQLLQEGIALARQGGVSDNLVWGLSFLFRLRVAQKDFADAVTVGQEAHAITQTYGVSRLSTLADAHLARLQLQSGQTQAAAGWAARQAAPRPPPDTFVALTLARIFLAQGDLAQAKPILLAVQQKATADGRQRAQIESLILLALLAQADGEWTTAVATLTQALQLAAPERFLRLFLDEGASLAALLPSVRPSAPGFVDELLAALQVEMGETAVVPSSPDALSEQETAVLQLLCAGLSNREIGAELFISPGTAKWHVHNILQKLGASNRAQAAVRARELGLVA